MRFYYSATFSIAFWKPILIYGWRNHVATTAGASLRQFASSCGDTSWIDGFNAAVRSRCLCHSCPLFKPPRNGNCRRWIAAFRLVMSSSCWQPSPLSGPSVGVRGFKISALPICCPKPTALIIFSVMFRNAHFPSLRISITGDQWNILQIEDWRVIVVTNAETRSISRWRPVLPADHRASAGNDRGAKKPPHIDLSADPTKDLLERWRRI